MNNVETTNKTVSTMASFQAPARQHGHRIMAEGHLASNDTWATRLNNNDLIIGSTGSGKTRYYVKPNLLQMNESVIVTDTKGSLLSEVGPVLRAHGYRILNIDFTDMTKGIGYNPLDYVGRNERTGAPLDRDIVKLAAMLCPVENHQEPFWDYEARTYIAMLVSYVLECLPEEQQNLYSVAELAGGLRSAGQKLPAGRTGQLLDKLAAERPDCFAARKWRTVLPTTTAERMHASVLGIVAEKLDVLTYDDTAVMFTRPDRISFRELGQRKTALFLTVSDTDRSTDRMVTLLYAQALQALSDFADRECPGHALTVPVRLFLDDFATNAVIPDFDNIVSVIRSRNIAVSVVLQSITQLEGLYGAAKAKTIMNGCDHLLYLGGQDVDTARFIGVKAHKTVDTILDQSVDTVWLFERGRKGKVVRLFDITKHERYCELPEAMAPESDPMTSNEPACEVPF